jgi:hypothetical protein
MLWRRLQCFGGLWLSVAETFCMDSANACLLFERLSDESASDFSVLLKYRDLGPGRSLRQAAALTGLSESTLRRLSKRWDWQSRLEPYDAALLQEVAAAGAEAEKTRHRAQLLAFRDAQHRRADRLAEAAERLLELVLESTREHLLAGTLLQPAQLGAPLMSAARALESSSSTAATALGVDQVLAALQEHPASL